MTFLSLHIMPPPISVFYVFIVPKLLVGATISELSTIIPVVKLASVSLISCRSGWGLVSLK